MECDFSSIGFESEADRADHISNCHPLAQAQQVEMTWDDMDYKYCFRVLCSAARERELGLVQSLLSLTSRNIVDPEDFGKLLLAAGEGQSADIIDLVISECKSIGHLGDLDKQLEKALQNAALSGSEALVRGLCRSKPPIDLNAQSTDSLSSMACRGYAPLHLAVLGRKESTVELLLDSGASVGVMSRSGGWTALHLAAKVGHGAIARLLLARGALANIDSPKEDGCTALHVAAWNGREAIAQLLLDRGAHPNLRKVGDRTVLQLAAESGHEAISRLLLDRGADIDAKVVSYTALMLAAEKGRKATCRLLIDRGADIGSKNGNGRTALHGAAYNGLEAIDRLVLDRGADIGAKTKDGKTALHDAAWTGNEATARLLLDRGADIGARVKDGETVLHYAALGGREAIARLLLDRGADIDAKNAKNETALHFATRNGHGAFAGLLRNRIATNK